MAQLIKKVHDADKLVMYHSCGAVEPLFDDFVEIGIDCFWHQTGLYDTVKFAKRAADTKVALYLQMDRQRLIPRGTVAEITNAVKRYVEIHKKLGAGAILYVEIENDAPFENVEALIKAIHKYR